jgi:hypothetical protein
MIEFKKNGGTLTGRAERYDAFEGEPRTVGKPPESTHSPAPPPNSSGTPA